jgi:riboflavin biosynthesis pyrimidine reductase
MISSIDGRLLSDRWTPPAAGLDAATLRGQYDEVAARFDAEGWIVGRKTMEELVRTTTRSAKTAAGNLRETYVADRKGRNVAVAIDPQGKLRYAEDHAGGDHIIAVLGEQVSDHYLSELRDVGASYLFAGAKGDDLPRALDTLGDVFGLRKLLLEGGGIINGAFLKARLIDEISVLIYPGIDGLAGIPSIFEYVGGVDEKPAAGLSLRHQHTETLYGGTVWLRYAVEND